MPESLPSPDHPAAPRRRGGQRGNLNALKHGFYAAKFRSSEITDLEACESTGLADEITMMRVSIRRVVEAGAKAKTLPERLDLLHALSHAVTSLTRLIKVQKYISGAGGNEELLAALKIATADVLDGTPLGRKDPPPSQ